MGENKLELMTQLMKKAQQCDQEQKTLIKHIVELQTNCSSNGLDQIADKLGEVFSTDSKAEEDLKKIAHDLEIEVNRLKNEAA